jgi:hypothetical protein
VEIISHTSISGVSYYSVFGEVKNNNSYQLNSLEITATFYNTAGTVVGTDAHPILIRPLIPNQKSPFDILHEFGQTIVAQIDHYSLAVSDFTVGGIEPYRGLTILSHNAGRDDYGIYKVEGEIQNTGTEAVGIGDVYITFYDATGQVVWVGSDLLANLAAGQVAPFSYWIPVASASARVSSYELQVKRVS